MKTVELRTAYAFDCEECGRENFVRAVVHEFSVEERTEMMEMFGEDQVDGEFVSVPETVQCSFCGCEFEPEGIDHASD